MPDRHLLNTEINTIKKKINTIKAETALRQRIVAIATGELGVREESGKNDGESVEAYLKSIQLGKGHAWCGAFLSWVYLKAGLPAPRIGWTPDLFPFRRFTKSPLPGDMFGIYFPVLKRIAHAGMVEKISSDWVISLEGNTNVKGSREGDGVFRKRRHFRTISRFANWIKKVEKS